MSHMIETAMYVARPAWHGLGNVLANAPTTAEGIKAAGLDWLAVHQDMFTTIGDTQVKMPNHVAVTRSTDGKLLGCVGRKQGILQNAQAFAWFDPFLESGDATLEAAGSLDGGKRIWVLAKIKDGTQDVVQGDPIEMYVLLAHAHDGSLAVRAGITKTRVVCQNTVNAAIGHTYGKGAGRHGNMLVLRHSKNVVANLDKARGEFDLARKQLKEETATYSMLATKACDDKNLVRYVREVLSPGSADDTETTVKYVDDVIDSYHNAPGQDTPATRGTLWGAFNAVTHWNTHKRGRNQENRVSAQWFGNNGEATQRALDVAVQFAEHAPDAFSLGKACYDNTATAAADFGALLSRPVNAQALTNTAPVAAE